jgi:predicted RNA methylase
MGRLSKSEYAAHRQAEEYLLKDVLTYNEKWFVLENYQESANHVNGFTGAFFTPVGLAKELAVICENRPTIDLCAGIGVLSFMAYHMTGVKDITCVEINPEYLKVGKKILPEAKWILGDITDDEFMKSLGKFYISISNPPFGNIAKNSSIGHLKYRLPNFELMAVEIASRVSDYGNFILPSMSVDFTNREQSHRKTDNNKAVDFTKITGIEFDGTYPIDTRMYDNDWKDVKVAVELACFDFQDVQNTQLF